MRWESLALLGLTLHARDVRWSTTVCAAPCAVIRILFTGDEGPLVRLPYQERAQRLAAAVSAERLLTPPK